MLYAELHTLCDLFLIVRDIVIPLTMATRCRFADLPCFVGTNYFGPADVKK